MPGLAAAAAPKETSVLGVRAGEAGGTDASRSAAEAEIKTRRSPRRSGRGGAGTSTDSSRGRNEAVRLHQARVKRLFNQDAFSPSGADAQRTTRQSFSVRKGKISELFQPKKPLFSLPASLSSPLSFFPPLVVDRRVAPYPFDPGSQPRPPALSPLPGNDLKLKEQGTALSRLFTLALYPIKLGMCARARVRESLPAATQYRESFKLNKKCFFMRVLWAPARSLTWTHQGFKRDAFNAVILALWALMFRGASLV